MTDQEDSSSSRPERIQEGGSIGFEAGKPVPLTLPKDIDPESAAAAAADGELRIRKETLFRLLACLSDGCRTSDQVGRKFYTLCYAFRAQLPSTPQSTEEFAKAIGVERSRAYEILKQYGLTGPDADIAKLLGDLFKT